MTIFSHNGEIEFTCNGPSCHEFGKGDSRDFRTLWEEAKSGGWIARKNAKGEWEHFCSSCALAKPNINKVFGESK